MDKIKNPQVAKIFKNYPEPFRARLLKLRRFILETALETEGAGSVEETLKWGEPSYLTKSGSTIRMDYKPAHPDQYAMYFNCKSRLVETFRELYGGLFQFEGNRAIVFNKNDKIPVNELKHCIRLALTYHKRKHLPMLGV
jgi:hypothetical protein